MMLVKRYYEMDTDVQELDDYDQGYMDGLKSAHYPGGIHFANYVEPQEISRLINPEKYQSGFITAFIKHSRYATDIDFKELSKEFQRKKQVKNIANDIMQELDIFIDVAFEDAFYEKRDSVLISKEPFISQSIRYPDIPEEEFRNILDEFKRNNVSYISVLKKEVKNYLLRLFISMINTFYSDNNMEQSINCRDIKTTAQEITDIYYKKSAQNKSKASKSRIKDDIYEFLRKYINETDTLLPRDLYTSLPLWPLRYINEQHIQLPISNSFFVSAQ